MGKAENLDGQRRGSVGFALTTLQRRLAADGTTYAAILDGVRRDTARQFLTGSDMPMSQIAAAVGLSEQSALTRSCRRWFGLTPREVRAGS